MRKPPHRRGQAEIVYLQARTSRRIVGFAVLAVALATGWAGMSQTDIDVRAIGTVVSRNGLVAIGTPAAGIVGASYLAPGRAVAAGEALVQMDDVPARERLADIGRRIAALEDEAAGDATGEQTASGTERRHRLDALWHRCEVAAGRLHRPAANADRIGCPRPTGTSERASEGGVPQPATGDTYQDIARALQQVETDLDRNVIRSPVAGRILRLRNFGPGAHLARGESLADIQEADDVLEVELRVGEGDLEALRPGLPVTLRLRSRSYMRYGFVRGTVRLIYLLPAAEPADSNVVVRVALAPPDHPSTVPLMDGQHVTADIRVGRETILGALLKPMLHTM